jgi:hypothetical protein
MNAGNLLPAFLFVTAITISRKAPLDVEISF